MDFNPTFLGEYSTDENNITVKDNSSKKCLHEKYSSDQELIPQIIMEYDETRYKDYTRQDTLYHHMFPWMEANQDKIFDKSKNRFKNDFFMSGKTFRRILKCSYEKQPKKFKVVRVLNMYLIYNDSKFKNFDAELEEKMNSFMGHQFELCLSSYSSDDEEPDPYQMVCSNKRHYHVLTGNIEDHKILYSANIDCISKSKSNDEEIPIEFFLRKGPLEDFNTFKFKRYIMLDIWCKGYIGNIPKTIFGFRTGWRITHLKVLETKKIPAIIQEDEDSRKYMWKPHVCKIVAERLFDFIKFESSMEERTIYTLTYTKKNRSNPFSLDKSLEQDIDSLPEWFLTKFQ